MSPVSKAIAWTAGIAAGGFAIVLIFMGTMHAGFWAQDQAAKQQGHVNNIQAQNAQQGIASQAGSQSSFDNDMNALSSDTGSSPAVRAERISTGNDACRLAAQMDSSYLTSYGETWYHTNCNGPTLKVTSPIHK